MGALNRSLLPAALLAAALGAPNPARADLAATSPFLPSGTLAAGAAAGPSGPIELRGVMPTDSGWAFCIYDTAKKKNVWVGLNEQGHDFIVKSADPGADSVTVSYQGRVMKLDLHTAKVATAPVQASPAGPAATVPLNPSPADEQRRLDAVAQEVRRRRAERERSAQEPGAQPPPGPPPAGR
jgi:hypothetical protein